MSGDNGDEVLNRDGTTKKPNSIYHDKHGRFAVGNPGGPGQPPGTRHIELMEVCRRKARKEGRDLEELLWGVVKGLMIKAGKGDAKAGKLILDRFCGTLEKAPQIAVDARQISLTPGPPIPPSRELGRCFAKLAEISKDLMTVPLDEPDEVEKEAIDELLRW